MATQHNLHAWRKRDTIIIKAILRDRLLVRPDVRAALNRYLQSLDLEGQVKAGMMTPNQALIAFEKALHDFSRRLHSELNRRYTKQQDTDDWANPANAYNMELALANPMYDTGSLMQLALLNPLSYYSQLLDQTSAAINTAIEEETVTNEKAHPQEHENAEHQHPEHIEHEAHETEKYLAVATAIKEFEEHGPNAEGTKNKIESAFFKHTGIASDFHKEEETLKEDFAKKLELKPQRGEQSEKDDKK